MNIYVKQLVNQSDDYLNIVNAVKDSYLPNGELNMDINNRYKYWITTKKFNFKKFNYNKLSDILGDECEEIDFGKEEGEWYKIFTYRGDFFEFYERGNKLVFIYSNNLDDIYDMDDIDDIKIKDDLEYEIINGKKYKKCPDGKVRNMKTMRCIKIKVEKKNVNLYIPINYPFNKVNVDRFLDECNKPFINPETKKIENVNTYNIAKKIIKNTQNIDFEKFTKLLKSNIDNMIDLLKKDRPLFINIGNHKRTYWLLKYIIDFINTKYPIIKIILIKSFIINDKNLIENDMIILLDEFIFTIDLGMYIEKIKNATNYKLRFFILSSFANKASLNFIKEQFVYLDRTGNELIFNKTIIEPKTTDNILSKNEMRLLTDIYKHLGDAFNKNLIYFDHNLGHQNYNLTAFYNGIVPNAENMYYLKKKNKNLNKLVLIPLFKHCQDITTYKLNNNCPKTINIYKK